jgi:hypothetical protein
MVRWAACGAIVPIRGPAAARQPCSQGRRTRMSRTVLVTGRASDRTVPAGGPASPFARDAGPLPDARQGSRYAEGTPFVRVWYALRPTPCRGRSASSWSASSRSLLDFVLEIHTPSRTGTGSDSPCTSTSTTAPRGTNRSPSRSTHWVRAARPRWNACCALLWPFDACGAFGAGGCASSGCTPNVDSRSCCPADSCAQVAGCFCYWSHLPMSSLSKVTPGAVSRR